jgi:hypothetical protein
VADVSGARRQGRLSLGPGRRGGGNDGLSGFIARVTSCIPDKGQVIVRYYGLCANAHIHRLPQVMNVKHYSRLTTIIIPGFVKHHYLSPKS